MFPKGPYSEYIPYTQTTSKIDLNKTKSIRVYTTVRMINAKAVSIKYQYISQITNVNHTDTITDNSTELNP